MRADEITPSRSVAAEIASFGLRDDPKPVEIPSSIWRSTFALLIREDLTGFAVAAAEADVLRLTERQLAELRRAHLEATTWTLALERALLRVTDAATAEGIHAVVLKGAALAHGFYPDPGLRPFTDIDLLVPKREWKRALALLERMGFDRELPEPRPGWDERFGKAAVLSNEQGLPIDMHRTLVLGAHAVWLDPEWLFSRTTNFSLGGRDLRRLDDTAMFVHVCMHASLGWWPPLLKPLRDALQVATVGAIDWDEVRSAAERWRLRAVLRHALVTAAGTLSIDLPVPASEMLRSLSESRRERRALAAYSTSKRSRGGAIRSTFWALPGVRPKAALLRNLLLPDARFLAARTLDGAKPSYLRRMSTPLRWLLRRPG